MTVVKITKNAEPSEYAVEVSGHSGYAESGKDIVCAAVSTVCNMLLAYLGNSATVDAREGYLKIIFCDGGEISRLLGSAISSFEHIEKNFPENLKIISFGGEN